MTIQQGDYVRPNNPSVGLPLGSVWFVVRSVGALELEPENDIAQRVNRGMIDGYLFPTRDFDKVVLCRKQWVSVNDADFLSEPTDFDPQPEYQPNSLFTSADTVDRAAFVAAQAASATAAMQRLLEDAQKREAERQEELRIAKAAKAKAAKEAAAKAKAAEAKRQLAARLHADRCLAEATLELIAEVSRLNNGGSEQVADASIAQHIDQLQALAKSYGYRIAKPSMLALVVKL